MNNATARKSINRIRRNATRTMQSIAMSIDDATIDDATRMQSIRAFTRAIDDACNAFATSMHAIDANDDDDAIDA
jgi:hypothetical protein